MPIGEYEDVFEWVGQSNYGGYEEFLGWNLWTYNDVSDILSLQLSWILYTGLISRSNIFANNAVKAFVLKLIMNCHRNTLYCISALGYYKFCVKNVRELDPNVKFAKLFLLEIKPWRDWLGMILYIMFIAG